MKKTSLLALALVAFSGCRAPSKQAPEEAAGEHRAQGGAEPHAHDDPFRELVLDQAALKRAGIEVEASRVESFRDVVEATAVAGPDESRIARVRPLAGGVVRQVFVNKGDRVRQGQALLVYDNIELGELLSLYRSRLAELRQALARREVADKLLERSRLLLKSQAVAEKEVELRQAEQVEAAEAERRSRYALEEAEVRLLRFGLSAEDLRGIAENPRTLGPEATQTRIRAPLGGTVIGYDVSPGEVVSPDRVLLTIADLSRLWVLADVFEKDLAAVRRADEARVRFEAYPDQVFQAPITYKGDILDPATRTAKLRCVVDNSRGLLKLGMFARVEIPSERARQAVTVPADAVHMIGDQAVVFVEEALGRFAPRRIAVLGEQAGRIGVAQGLQAGERVVGAGSFALKSELLREQLGGGHEH